jgi:hypothetical protein
MKRQRFEVGPEQGYPARTSVKLDDEEARRLGLTDADVSTLRTTADARPRPLQRIPAEADDVDSERCPGSGFRLGVRPRKGEKAGCPLCLQMTAIDRSGMLAVHDRPTFSLTVTIPTSNPLEVEKVVAESREAADHWSGRMWRRR